MRLPTSPVVQPIKNVVVVPIARLNRPALQALRYARSLSENVMAVHVEADEKQAGEVESAWERLAPGVPLTIIDSPYRSLSRPLLQYLHAGTRLKRTVTVLKSRASAHDPDIREFDITADGIVLGDPIALD